MISQLIKSYSLLSPQENKKDCFSYIYTPIPLFFLSITLPSLYYSFSPLLLFLLSITLSPLYYSSFLCISLLSLYLSSVSLSLFLYLYLSSFLSIYLPSLYHSSFSLSLSIYLYYLFSLSLPLSALPGLNLLYLVPLPLIYSPFKSFPC